MNFKSLAYPQLTEYILKIFEIFFIISAGMIVIITIKTPYIRDMFSLILLIWAVFSIFATILKFLEVK